MCSEIASSNSIMVYRYSPPTDNSNSPDANEKIITLQGIPSSTTPSLSEFLGKVLVSINANIIDPKQKELMIELFVRQCKLIKKTNI